MPLVSDPSVVVSAFGNLSNTTNATLTAFLQEYFLPAGSDIQVWTPSDWQPSPPLLANISDPLLKTWASELNQIWQTLGRQVSQEVLDNPQRHTLLPSRHPFIVPGGRFREWYYWDAFWIIEGLLACNMNQTVKGMLMNYLDQVETLGHVPNGGRLYYEHRSQPPVLSLMVGAYFNATKDVGFLHMALPILAKEYKFWMTKRVREITPGVHLNVYDVGGGQPRPEGYVEDINSASSLPASEKPCLYNEIQTMAETGWDFSTRWFSDRATLAASCASTLAPADLNAILLRVENTLSLLSMADGDVASAGRYALAAGSRKQAMEALMWSAQAGTWLDYNVTSKTQAPLGWYPSNVVPLWAGANTTPARVTAVLSSLGAAGVLGHPGGVPTSLINSGQQWDLPNAWPPLQYFLIEALRESKVPAAEAQALALAQKWVSSNYAAYQQYKVMFEKYDSETFGQPGGGGEYDVQSGFGWTNGVVLSLLKAYGSVLHT